MVRIYIEASIIVHGEPFFMGGEVSLVGGDHDPAELNTIEHLDFVEDDDGNDVDTSGWDLNLVAEENSEALLEAAEEWHASKVEALREDAADAWCDLRWEDARLAG